MMRVTVLSRGVARARYIPEILAGQPRESDVEIDPEKPILARVYDDVGHELHLHKRDDFQDE